MPVRSLSSSVLRWPSHDEVHAAFLRWAGELRAKHRSLIAAGYFGSYADGNWGVGSDLDIVLIVPSDRRPFERRALEIDTSSLPVPVDLLVYTKVEFDERRSRGDRFARVMSDAVVWAP